MAGPDSNPQPSNSFTQTTVLKVGYATIAVVSLVMFLRIGLQSMRPRRLAAEDYCMFFAYALFVSQCALYIAMSPIRDKINDVTDGKIAPYATLMADAKMLGKLYFPALLFFWTILWAVKFGLLLLYRKLTIGLVSIYNKVWWFLVVFCGITLIGNYVAFLTSCDTLGSFFEGAGCHDRTRQFLSIWYSYCADTITNMMLIAFPMHLMWNLQMPKRQKTALLTLFASGVVCIIIATLRAAQITANTIKTNATIDGTWLAVWGMVESAVAVVIGFCPSFAVLIRATRKSSKKASYNAGGYVKQDGASFNLQTIGGISTRSKDKKLSADNTDTFWTDVHSSQEELAGGHKQRGIRVSTTIQQQPSDFDTTK